MHMQSCEFVSFRRNKAYRGISFQSAIKNKAKFRRKIIPKDGNGATLGKAAGRESLVYRRRYFL